MINNQKLVLGFAPTRRKMYDPAFAHENVEGRLKKELKIFYII